MTHPTDEELDAMARDLCHTGELSMPYRCEISDAIMSIRAQLAEAKADKEKLGRELNLARYGQPDFSWQVHKEALAAANARADRAEAALAALEAAPHVNETPKSEHDSADVLPTLPAAAVAKGGEA